MSTPNGSMKKPNGRKSQQVRDNPTPKKLRVKFYDVVERMALSYTIFKKIMNHGFEDNPKLNQDWLVAKTTHDDDVL